MRKVWAKTYNISDIKKKQRLFGTSTNESGSRCIRGNSEEFHQVEIGSCMILPLSIHKNWPKHFCNWLIGYPISSRYFEEIHYLKLSCPACSPASPDGFLNLASQLISGLCWGTGLSQVAWGCTRALRGTILLVLAFWSQSDFVHNRILSIFCIIPMASMGRIYLPTFTYIYHKNHPNVGKYAIHWCYGICIHQSITIKYN